MISLTRRQILEAFLAAPVALSACSRAAPNPIAGELLGASVDVGHRLRDLKSIVRPTDAKRVKVAIIGAGPSGLSAAWRLERLGVRDFRVFDLEPREGGTSTFGTSGAFTYPWGAHYVPLPSAENRTLVTLLSEMGALEAAGGDRIAGKEEQLVRAPEERVFYTGKWYEGLYLRVGASADDIAQYEKFQREVDTWVRFRGGDGKRAFSLPSALGTRDIAVTDLDKISIVDWMNQKGFSSSRLRWLVDYACRDDYGLRAEDTSAYAGLFYFASRVGSAGEEAADLLAWPNGNGHIVQHLSGVAGDRIQPRSLVLDVIPRENEVEILLLRTDTQQIERWIADSAVFAAPKFLAPYVIAPLRDRPPAPTDYGAWMVANIHLRSRPGSRGFPTAWDNVLYDSPSLGYVVSTHQSLIDHGPTVWTYYYPLTDNDPKIARNRLLSLSHAEWAHIIVSDLARAHIGFEQQVERIDVWRWGHAMARPKTGLLFSGARDERAKPIGRLHFAHSDLSGMGLFEEAQYWGVKAAEDIVGAGARFT